jgi:hypothetical protein
MQQPNYRKVPGKGDIRKILRCPHLLSGEGRQAAQSLLRRND